jgi:hypothetical protein
MTPRERDEFERIKLSADVERRREILVQYEEGLALYRTKIEEDRYDLGKIDQRLGG